MTVTAFSSSGTVSGRLDSWDERGAVVDGKRVEGPVLIDARERAAGQRVGLQNRLSEGSIQPATEAGVSVRFCNGRPDTWLMYRVSATADTAALRWDAADYRDAADLIDEPELHLLADDLRECANRMEAAAHVLEALPFSEACPPASDEPAVRGTTAGSDRKAINNGACDNGDGLSSPSSSSASTPRVANGSSETGEPRMAPTTAVTTETPRRRVHRPGA